MESADLFTVKRSFNEINTSNTSANKEISRSAKKSSFVFRFDLCAINKMKLTKESFVTTIIIS